MREPEYFDVTVDGGSLRVARWGERPEVVFGIHGVTGSSMGMAALAPLLVPRVSLLAPDLRGRGCSASLPERPGLQAHAADCAQVLDATTDRPVTVVGHSMGAYVGVVLAASRPDLVSRLVLVDGGLPLPPVPGLDPDAALAAVLGPAIERLRRTFRTHDEYREFWRAHPALTQDWNGALEAYIAYDLEGEPPEMRSRVSEAAVRGDMAMASLADSEVVSSSLRTLECPVVLLRAPRGLLNQPVPLLSTELARHWQAQVPQLVDEIVDETNHYTIMFGPRGVQAIAAHVLARREEE